MCYLGGINPELQNATLYKGKTWQFGSRPRGRRHGGSPLTLVLTYLFFTFQLCHSDPASMILPDGTHAGLVFQRAPHIRAAQRTHRLADTKGASTAD